MCILPLAQGLDELLAIMSGGADAASATASAIDAAAAAAADEAAEAAASGLGDWSSGTSVDVGLPDDVGGGGNGAAPELLMSKVVAARKTVLRASGHVDPLYLLEAVQVGGDASGTALKAVGKGSGAECGDRGLGPASQLISGKEAVGGWCALRQWRGGAGSRTGGGGRSDSSQRCLEGCTPFPRLGWRALPALPWCLCRTATPAPIRCTWATLAAVRRPSWPAPPSGCTCAAGGTWPARQWRRRAPAAPQVGACRR